MLRWPFQGGDALPLAAQLAGSKRVNLAVERQCRVPEFKIQMILRKLQKQPIIGKS
jgi:hypothetical protein